MPDPPGVLREATLQVNGARLFNCLPAEIRNITKCSEIKFKEELDKFLTNIPDQPMTGGLLPHVIDPVTGRHSNSLLHQVREHDDEDCGIKDVAEAFYV